MTGQVTSDIVTFSPRNSVWTARASAPLCQSVRLSRQNITRVDAFWPEILSALASLCRGGKKFAPFDIAAPHPKSPLLHPNATVALGCETLHWVAAGLPRHQIALSIRSNPLKFKGFQGSQTEVRPRQTRKLISGRVALGCRILSFPRCLLFQESQKRSKLQNEPNFKIKPIKPKLNRFLKMQPYATLDVRCLTSSSSLCPADVIQAYSRSIKPIQGQSRLFKVIQALKKIVIFLAALKC